MTYEIVYVCNSINNKNVRDNELKILRKFEDNLYFEFGESEANIKKRFYEDIETLNKDFEAIEKIKQKIEQGDIKENNNESKNETSREISKETRKVISKETVGVDNKNFLKKDKDRETYRKSFF